MDPLTPSGLEQANPELAPDLTLEIEGRAPDWAALRAAAEKTGVVWADHDQGHGPVSGCFQRSLTHFRVDGAEDKAPHEPAAQGPHGCDFLTRYALIFRPTPGRQEACRQDLKLFLTQLSQQTDMQFVLSSPYGDVRALRDLRRFEWLWDEGSRRP